MPVLSDLGQSAIDRFTARDASGELAVTHLAQLAIDWGSRIVGAIVVLIVAWIFASWVRKTIYRVLDRPRMDQTLVRFFSNASRWVVLLFALVACLGIFGINTTSVVAVIGAAGLAIGLAMQGSLSNLAAGVMLLVLRPFRVGDSITVAGFSGKVDDIDLFNTKLDTADHRRLILPNSLIFGNTIENTTHHARRRVDLTITVAHGADAAITRRVLRESAEAVTGRLADGPVDVVLADYSPAGVSWLVAVWALAADFGGVKDRLIVNVKQGLERERIGVAVPQREVVVRDERGGDAATTRSGEGSAQEAPVFTERASPQRSTR